MILCKLVCGRMKIITFGTHVVVSAEAARAVSSIGFDFFRWVQPLRAPAARFEKNYEAKRGACAEPCCGSSLMGKTAFRVDFTMKSASFTLVTVSGYIFGSCLGVPPVCGMCALCWDVQDSGRGDLRERVHPVVTNSTLCHNLSGTKVLSKSSFHWDPQDPVIG